MTKAELLVHLDKYPDDAAILIEGANADSAVEAVIAYADDDDFTLNVRVLLIPAE